MNPEGGIGIQDLVDDLQVEEKTVDAMELE